MFRQRPLLIASAIGTISLASVILILSDVGVFSREPSIEGLFTRQDDVKAEFDDSGTAIITLREGEKSAAVIVDHIDPTDGAQLTILQSSRTHAYKQEYLRAGEGAFTCDFKITALDVTQDFVTLNMTQRDCLWY